MALVIVDFHSFSDALPVEIRYLRLLHLGNISRECREKRNNRRFNAGLTIK
jgi:hypothetical protein